MPGLSQLKQFNKDLLSLGDEITIRASRGEKPVQVVIPKEVEDKNDSEDFVLGMPEIEAEIENTPIDEDLSDLAGLASPSSSASEGSEPAPSFEAPDLSSLLNPINVPDDASAGTDMPDLSMFEEQEEVVEEEIEEEPDEISIADMGLDALLSGGGFDAPEEEPEPEPEAAPLNINDFSEVEDLDSFDIPEETPEPVEDIPADDGLSELERDLMASMGNEGIDFGSSNTKTKEDPSLDDLLGNIGLAEDSSSESAKVEDGGPLEDFGLTDDLEDIGEPVEEVEEAEPAGVSDLESFDLDAPVDFDTPADLQAEPLDDALEEIGDEPAEAESVEGLEAFDSPDSGDFDIPETPSDDFDLPETGSEGGLDNFDLPEMDFGSDEAIPESQVDLSEVSDFDEPEAAGLDDFEAPEDFDSGAEEFDSGVEDFEEIGPETTDIPEAPEADDFQAGPDLSDFNLEGISEIDEAGIDSDTDTSVDSGLDSGMDSGIEDFDIPEAADELPASDNIEPASGLDSFGLDDMDFGAAPESVDAPAGLEEESSSEAGGMESFGLDDMDFGTPDMGDSSEASDAGAESGGLDSFGLDDMDFGSSDSGEAVDFNAEEEIPDYEDSAIETEAEGEDEGFEDGNQEIEVFDTTDMDGMDFGIQDTDAQLGGEAAGGDFEFGSNDDFAMEGEFEIPGFSDVATAKEEKSKTVLATSGKKGKNLPEPDFSGAAESEDLPPNTLSDAQYKQFLKNLGEYPLNVRLAFEDLIVQDEFTDDAEFEVIEKILNKAPARQVASMLEKMLDISIPVPRDFEHRTAEEYEAYKKSLSYQLRNKIIPGALVGIALLFVVWGLFNFGKNCIYKPLKANKLYKQGYALLQADEYPQSEMKFEEAVTYRINKKWFFNYARGYREHKQYQRAGTMYQRILNYFKHDKAAGLEYADMELNDLANYERAEEIVRRQVLDYHINDADGILKLGDIFLEWGTEKDSNKLENAREQYATLIQLYGSTDLYLSRMMRYFIRSDNLRQVIQMQKTFEKKEKALGAADLAELSGYLLDKYYGTLAPADEYLRYEIEGLRGLLLKAVKADPDNPIALYNLAKYFIKSGETSGIESTLQKSIEKFNTIKSMKKRDIYKYIDSYRLLGEHYIGTTDYLQAQEQFAEGISLYTTERDNAGFEGTPDIGKLYEDMGNIKYSISGDYNDALMNYKYSVELENDNSSIRYRIGYIQYKNKNYVEALGSFMKAGDGNVKERNLLLAMANTLSLRGDDYAAQGYYNQLLDTLDVEIAKRGLVFPQTSVKDYDVVNSYLYAANNYGVTLYKLAKRTGNSGLNAQAIVQFQQSLRAWDALTRNQETMVRLGGSNLAEQNIQYITHPIPEFEPSIYTDIAKTLMDNEHL